MVLLKRSRNCGQQRVEQTTASLPEGDQFGERKSLFGSVADSDLLVWLRGLALDPCDVKAESGMSRKMWNQTIRLRNVMSLSNNECPWRKRKLQQFLNSGKLPAASGLASKRIKTPNVNQLGTGYISSLSIPNSVDATECPNVQTVLNSCSSDSILTSEDSFRAKQFYPNVSSLDNAADWGPSIKHVSPLIDTEESVNGSNPLSPENLVMDDGPMLCCDDLVCSPEWTREKFQYPAKHQKAVKFLKREAKKQKAVKFLKCDYKSRPVIPVGPSFQAALPEWKGPVNKKNVYVDGDMESLKWIGTPIWPTEGKSTRIIVEEVGEGRPDSCSCVSQGSAKCVKRHVMEESRHLQSELGPAFSSWKFHEMGEVVSQSWTLNEQKKFKSLIKNNLLSNEKTSFWRKSFPSKSLKDILSYYYNVFIPRRLSQLTKLSLDGVNSEDDDEDKVDEEDVELSRSN